MAEARLEAGRAPHIAGASAIVYNVYGMFESVNTETTPASGLPLQSLSEQIADLLRVEVLSGHLEGGQKLAQEELATRFDVSRIPVRDALRKLESEGLVTYSRNGGARVARLDGADLEELYEMRLAIEPRNARRAALLLSEDDLSRMEHLLQEMSSAPDAHGWHEAHARFHEALNTASRFKRMNELIENLRKHTERYVRFYQTFAGEAAALAREHERILQTARSHDPDATEEAVRSHLSMVRDKVFAALEQRQAPSHRAGKNGP